MRDSSYEIQQLRNELQLAIELRQESMMHDMREMMAELMRNDGPSESSSAEGSAAVRASPRGAEPTSVRGNDGEASAAERGSQQRADPLLRHDKFLLLVLLLLEAECKDIQQQQERRRFVRIPRVVLEWRDAGVPLSLSRLALKGVSQISQGGLENRGHTPAASWE